MFTTSVGLIVHVLIGHDFDGTPVLRPALIVRVWTDNCVNVQLFLDGGNDDRYIDNIAGAKPYIERGNAPVWLTSTTMGECVGEWRWPEVTA